LIGKLRRFLEYFPELQGRRVVGILGSWSIPEALVQQLTGAGIYALQMGEETMELSNAAALESAGR
jgi:RecB family endonuclease NucS